MPKQCRLALRIQAFYYVTTGAWPLLSRRTFEAVTGPKREWWLVQMVGLLALANGVAIAVGTRKRVREEVLVLSALSALSFAAIDTVYVIRREIRPVYLADAIVEGLVLLALSPSIRP